MSDVIYYDNEVVGLEVVMNEVDSEVSPEGYIFVRNGRDEIKGYVDGILKPELNDFTLLKEQEIAQEAETALSNTQYQIDAYVQETTKPDLDAYTEEKKQDIQNYAQNIKADFDADVQAAAASAQAAKTSENNAKLSETTASQTVNGFDAHAAEKQSAFDTHVETQIAAFDANASRQVQQANLTITQHQQSLVDAFDIHAAEIQGEVDASAQAAKTSETNAKNSETACQDVLQRLGTVIKIKGRVDSIAELPLQDNLDGDAYLVGESGSDNFAEYFWFSDHWEFLGTTGTKLSWGNITGDIAAQTDLQQALSSQETVLSNALSEHANNHSNPHAVTKAQVGLGNCDNTSDVNKPISTAVQSALNLKANLASPAFSGTPTVPTPAVSNNSTQAINSQWFNQKVQVVSSLPSAPDTNVFYFVTQ